MDAGTFLDRVRAYHVGGWRLIVINGTSVLPGEELPDGAVDVDWAFALGSQVQHLRERFLPGDELPSISSVYWAAFLYENEIRELFGVPVSGLVVDLQGQLFKTSQRVPFAPGAIKARLEAAGRLEQPAHPAEKAEKPA